MAETAAPMNDERQRSGTGDFRRSSVVATWPPEIDLDVWYQSERADVDDLIKRGIDMSVWSLEARRDHVTMYAHCKNNEQLAFSLRAVTKVTGTVPHVVEALRAPDNATFRSLQKLLHARNYLDAEVLHSHQRKNPDRMESLCLKWVAYSSPKTLGRSKEFLMREYCSIISDHPTYGTVGILKFESYDGVGARYAIRAKPDTYSLAVYEPSWYVVQQTPEEGVVTVTLTFNMRKARGNESVTSGIRLLSTRLAMDTAAMQRTVQHTMFQPNTFVTKQDWVNDGDRSNCSLCVQSFGMLKRRHHCRVCGEVVCSSCTVFKLVTTDQELSKLRVCKACLAKSSDTAAMTNSGIGNNSTSSTMSTMSDDSYSSSFGPTNDHVGPAPPQLQQQTSFRPYSSAHSSNGSSLSMSDLKPNSEYSGSPPHDQPVALANTAPSVMHSPPTAIHSPPSVAPPALLHKSLSTDSSTSSITSSSHRSHKQDRRISYFNEDFEEICMLAMETLNCPMAGIRTDDFELVRYYDRSASNGLPRSLPTFRRIASRGKPCIVLDVSSDKRISGEKRFTAKLQFFVGIPLMMDGEVIGDLCVADRYARENIDYKQVDVLTVLGETVTQYMHSHDYMEDLVGFRNMQRKKTLTGGAPMQATIEAAAAEEMALMGLNDGGVKEVAF